MSVSFGLDSNNDIIAKLKAEIDRLTKDNLRLNDQIIK